MRAANKSNDIIRAFVQCHGTPNLASGEAAMPKKSHRAQPELWLTQGGKNTSMRQAVAKLACADLMQ